MLKPPLCGAWHFGSHSVERVLQSKNAKLRPPNEDFKALRHLPILKIQPAPTAFVRCEYTEGFLKNQEDKGSLCKRKCCFARIRLIKLRSFNFVLLFFFRKFLKEREKTFFKKLSRKIKVFEVPRNFLQKVSWRGSRGRAPSALPGTASLGRTP